MSPPDTDGRWQMKRLLYTPHTQTAIIGRNHREFAQTTQWDAEIQLTIDFSRDEWCGLHSKVHGSQVFLWLETLPTCVTEFHFALKSPGQPDKRANGCSRYRSTHKQACSLNHGSSEPIETPPIESQTLDSRVCPRLTKGAGACIRYSCKHSVSANV